MLRLKYLVAAIAFVSTSANAAIVYDEAINGDFSANPDGSTPITLYSGNNVIKGSAAFGGESGPSDLDGFKFEIAAGHTLVSITLDWVITKANGWGLAWDNALVLGEWPGLYDDEQWLPLMTTPSPVQYFTSTLPLDSGVYTMIHYATGCACDDTTTWDYSWTFEVASSSTDVPEPAALALFGLGLAGLGITRRRKMA
ncbi:PEP-CTERM sorting domain-containing protein [Sphingosinicella sp.]|uniref:PEP-CTERM sorting domain-containing protein n=1 Tax=Sphingosinicella sp. TaxID=1917971 RepID=UPI00183D31B9|nr:PEP-CTERM sorting domain-containing protein [Sphingosinicella sp.]MBA4757396.1 PEP-CTERM sorting domain-containing protein [Sphingosinicella sp.]